MGTSGSSSGSPSGTPLVPPWVENPGETGDSGEFPFEPDNAPDSTDQSAPPSQVATPVAPPSRFGSARRNVGQYASSGDISKLRRGLGQYVSSGYGGSSTATKRFSGTIRTAGRLYGALSSIASSDSSLSGTRLDPSVIQNRTARQVIGAIVEAARPSDGTQDAEATRKATTDAFSELYEKYPDADLLDLDENQRLDVMEFFIGNDIFNRVYLDLGMAIRDKASSAEVASQRMMEMRQYIKNEVARIFREEKRRQTHWNAASVSGLVRRVIAKTFQVFEGEV